MRLVNPASSGTGLRPRGDFDPATLDYQAGDAVSDGGLTYVCTDVPLTTVVTRNDDFTRADDPSGWGTASDAEAWTVTSESGGASAAISGDQGYLASGSGFSVIVEALGDPLDAGTVDMLVRWADQGLSSIGPFFMLQSGSALRYAYVQPNPDGGCNVFWNLDSASDNSTVSWAGSSTGTVAWTRLRLSGRTLAGRVWLDGQPEPSTWTQNTLDSALDGPTPKIQFAGGSGAFSVAQITLTLTSVPRPSTDSTHWALLAAAAPGTPTLYGPLSLDYTKLVNDDVATLYAPQTGDVLLRLFADPVTAAAFDFGEITIAAGGTTLWGTTPDGIAVDRPLPYVHTATDPVTATFTIGGGDTVGMGHIDLYALVVHPVSS